MAKELVHSFEGDMPEGWATATIGDLISPEGMFIDGNWVESKDQDPNGDVRLIQLADIADGYYKDKSERFLTKEKALELNCTFLKKGDVLIARMPDPLGRACIFPGDAKESVTVVDVCVVRTGTEDVNHNWLMYWVNSPRFRNTIASLQSGTTRKRISRGNLATITFPVPPSEQQKRIVAKIEELFSHINAGIEALKKAKQLLKQYRQSVLKAAVTGKLTEQWRADRAAEVNAQGSANAAGGRTPGVATKETAQELLERILKERRQKWEEQQLEQFKAKGKMPKGDKWRDKYQRPTPIDTPDLPDLPQSWTWATLDEVGQEGRPIIYGIIKPGPHVEDGVPYVRVMEMKDGIIDINVLKKASKERAAKFARATLKNGDVLISKDGTIGRVAIVPPELEGGNITQHVMRAPINEELSNVYVATAIQSPFCQIWLAGETKGVALKGVNVEDFRRLPIPVPPVTEQKVISEVYKEKTSAISRLEKEIDHQTIKAEKNKQVILAAAFSGKLVEPNEDDEDANILLSRIREKQDSAIVKRKVSKKRAKTRKVIDMSTRKVINVLKETNEELNSLELFEAAGYSHDMPPEKIEEFYLDLKSAVKLPSVEVAEVTKAGVKQDNKFRYKG